MKVTSALANKMVRQLEEEKDYLIQIERESGSYTAALGEEPVIPEYDYREMADKLNNIDRKIMKIRHAVNMSNAANEVETDEGRLTIDALLVRMAQLNDRKCKLDEMRKKLPRERLNSTASWGSVSKAPEYRYLNYDLEQVKDDFEKVNHKIYKMQLALDKYNQTHEFEIDV